MMGMQKNQTLSMLRQAATVFLLSLFVLVPLIVLPISEQPIIVSKSLLFFAGTLVTLALFIAYSLQRKVISFVTSPLTAPLLLFGGATLASSLFTNNYPVEHLLGFGGLYLSLVVMGIFGPTIVDKKTLKTWFPTVAVGLGGLLTLSSILQLLGVGPSHIFSQVFPVDFPNNMLFNLAGSSLLAFELLVVLTVGMVAHLVFSKKTSIVHQIGTLVLVGGVLLHGWSLLPGKPSTPILLPYAASWSISIDTLKAPRTALIGFGPQAFGNAYNQFKPNWINRTDLWNVLFTQGSNAPFTLLVTTGLLGLSAWLLLFYKVARQTFKTTADGRIAQYMLLTTFVIQLVLPPSIVILALQGMLLVVWKVLEESRFDEIEVYGLTLRRVKNKTVAHPMTNNARAVLYSFTVVMVLLIGVVTYALGRNTIAHYQMLASLSAAQEGNAIGVYNSQQLAVQMNPYNDSFRRRYASTNLTIAAALAQKADRTPEENQQFSQLVQQAIREAKAATLLDQTDSANWASLAQVYRSLIGAAADADQWAVTSYIQAIQTDPQNPQLRVELGGILYGAENYVEAAQFFQQSIDLKPDYANAYYNLANTLANAGDLQNAKLVYQQTLQLVPADSEDYLQASNELQQVDELLQQQLEQQAAAGQAEGQAAQGLTQQQPSLTSGSLLESPTDTVNQPSTQQLNLDPQAGTPQEAPDQTSPLGELDNSDL